MAMTNAEKQRARRQRIIESGGLERPFFIDSENLKILEALKIKESLTYDQAINKIIQEYSHANSKIPSN